MQKVNFERAVVADVKGYSYVQMKAFGEICKGKLTKTYFSETLNSMMIRNSQCYKIIKRDKKLCYLTKSIDVNKGIV